MIGTTSTEAKAAKAREAGADEVVLYSQKDFVEEVNRITAGKGVNAVYDGVGKATFLKSEYEIILLEWRLTDHKHFKEELRQLTDTLTFPVLLNNIKSEYLSRRLISYNEVDSETDVTGESIYPDERPTLETSPDRLLY